MLVLVALISRLFDFDLQFLALIVFVVQLSPQLLVLGIHLRQSLFQISVGRGCGREDSARQRCIDHVIHGLCRRQLHGVL